ncbi:hypothetical protein [Pseudobutyrivibrio xylanivorans]|nr:hypothetical protein [Pseudobutyrivibrio xylanivorans]
MLMAMVYYLESLTGIKYLTMLAGPIATLVAVAHYSKKGRPSVFNAGEQFRWSYLILFAIIYIAATLNVQVKYLFALGGQTTQVYHDILFHTGNIVSLSRSFPGADIRIDGLTFYYHYYFELIFAMCKHIFGMDAFSVYMNGNSLISAFPLTLALITIGERIRGGRVVTPFKYFFFCSGILVSGIALLPLNVAGGRFPLSWSNNHFFGNINAMGLAVALTILMVDILAELWYDSLDHKNLIAIYLLSCAATGFKGTTGAMLVGITWSVFVIESCIMKKFHLQQLLYNAVLTLGFILTCIFVTVGLNPSGANNRSMEITCQGTLEAGRVGQLIEKLGFNYMSFPWVVLAVLLTVICIIGPCIIAFVPFTFGKFKTLIQEGVIGDIFDWFSIGMILMGLIGFCAVSVPGLSQGYFVITTAGLIFYCAMKYMSLNRLNNIYKIMHFCFFVGLLILIADVANFCCTDYKQMAVYGTPADDRADLVSSDTMEAYLWLRDNTEEDAKIAVDRLSEELDHRSIYFYASAFSERQCYLEGYDYSDIAEKQVEAMLATNEKFFSDNFMEAQAAMEINGIDYLVVTKQMHPDFQPESQRFELVFKNSDVTIYKYM